MKKNCFFFLILLFVSAVAKSATAPSDSVQVSLLTCSPGTEIYNLFGHTAIRYQNKNENIDVVFNYGVFNFNKPHFIFRFTLGQTDYELGVDDYQAFAENYIFSGRSVEEQILNLTSIEKEKLYQLLLVNYLPENRIYRYNFFDDNCSTRPRDKIEESIIGKVEYVPYNKKKSFRDIIHEYTIGHPWSRFGIDFCLGAAADKPIVQRQMMFCPFYLRDFVEKAKIVGQGGVRPLVLKHDELIISQTTKHDKKFLTPFQCMLLLFVIATIVSIYELRKKKSIWVFDLILFTFAGLAGCIIAFLMLFSTHPTVSSNFLILLLHPFYLFCLPWIIMAEKTYRKSLPILVFFVILTLFIAFYGIIPQKFDVAIVPLALSLWVRLGSHILLTYKLKK